MFVDGEGNLLHGYFRISNWRSWLKDMMPAEEVSVTKKGTVVNLTICPGILTIFPDTSIDKEYTRFINGKLAFGMFDGRLYEEGKPFEGHKDDKYYKNGVPYTGFVVSEGGYYKDGELFTGLEQGIYYNKGITSAGKYNGILYGKYGKPFTDANGNTVMVPLPYQQGTPIPVPQTDEHGNPILVPKTDSYGKPMTDENGHTIMVPLPATQGQPTLAPLTLAVRIYGLPMKEGTTLRCPGMVKPPARMYCSAW